MIITDAVIAAADDETSSARDDHYEKMLNEPTSSSINVGSPRHRLMIDADRNSNNNDAIIRDKRHFLAALMAGYDPSYYTYYSPTTAYYHGNH